MNDLCCLVSDDNRILIIVEVVAYRVSSGVDACINVSKVESIFNNKVKSAVSILDKR